MCSSCVSHNVRTLLHTDAGNAESSLNHNISLVQVARSGSHLPSTRRRRFTDPPWGLFRRGALRTCAAQANCWTPVTRRSPPPARACTAPTLVGSRRINQSQALSPGRHQGAPEVTWLSFAQQQGNPFGASTAGPPNTCNACRLSLIAGHTLWCFGPTFNCHGLTGCASCLHLRPGEPLDILCDSTYDKIMRPTFSGTVRFARAAPPCKEYSRLKLRPGGPKAIRSTLSWTDCLTTRQSSSLGWCKVNVFCTAV